MIRGWMSKASAALLLTASALALSTVSAQAADLGGNCCADLEERIAELEATTARKGNRKVCLEISGQVNEALHVLGRRHGKQRLHGHQRQLAHALPFQGQGEDQQRSRSRLPA